LRAQWLEHRSAPLPLPAVHVPLEQLRAAVVEQARKAMRQHDKAVKP
jgi:hypothetical protein